MTNRQLAGIWYAHQGLMHAIPVYPVYAIMMLGHVSPAELALLFAIWAGVGLVAEVPAGMFADQKSRRWVLFLSAGIKLLAFAAWLFLPSFGGYALGFICWGISSALYSGTAEALLYERLAERDETASFDRIYGRGQAANNAAVALSLAVGGWLAQVSYALPLILSMSGPLLGGALILITFGDPARTAMPDDEVDADDAMLPLRVAWREARSSRIVGYLLLALCLVPVVHGVFDEFVAPLLQERGIDLGVLGMIYAGCFLAAAAGAALAEHIDTTHFGAPLLGAAIGAGVLGLVFAPGLWLIAIGLIAHFGINGLVEVRLAASLQHGITGTARATATSLARFGESAVAILLYGLFGVVAQWRSFTEVALACIVLTLLICTVLALLHRRWFPDSVATAA